jgi:hypothetical protein
MNYLQKLAPFLLLAVLGGCATFPPGPSVNVLPAKGKSFDTFRAEDAACRQWAEEQLAVPPHETYEKNVATGAVAGTAIGTGLGAVMGSASGHAGEGALIGAVSGLLVGTAAGSSAGQAYGNESQRRYDNAYVQCMYSYGNQVPGYRRIATPSPAVAAAPSRPPVGSAPPPPPPQAVAVAPPPPPPVASPEPGNYPPPPEVYLDEAPQFIYSPALSMYVAVGAPYDLVYTGNAYFYFYGGRWYRGPYYNGPWAFVPVRSYPAVFVKYRINTIRHSRDAEFRRYEHDREHYDGRFHRPAFRGEKRKIEHRAEFR